MFNDESVINFIGLSNDISNKSFENKSDVLLEVIYIDDNSDKSVLLLLLHIENPWLIIRNELSDSLFYK